MCHRECFLSFQAPLWAAETVEGFPQEFLSVFLSEGCFEAVIPTFFIPLQGKQSEKMSSEVLFFYKIITKGGKICALVVTFIYQNPWKVHYKTQK